MLVFYLSRNLKNFILKFTQIWFRATFKTNCLIGLQDEDIIDNTGASILGDVYSSPGVTKTQAEMAKPIKLVSQQVKHHLSIRNGEIN